MITDLLSPDAVQDPHAVYRALREHAPVTWLPEHRAWFVADHAGVAAGFRDARLSSDRLTPLEERLDARRRAILGETFELLRGWMVFHDPPHHERLRGPVRRAFTPKAVERLRAFAEDVVDESLARCRERLHDGEVVDLVRELAFPLPAIVIAELLGVPAGDRAEFKTWSSELAAIVFGASSAPDQAERAARGAARFASYFRDLVADHERHPRDDLISALVAARDEADPPLAATELVGACTLLLFGGHETTTGLIGNAACTLLTHPDQRRWLRDRPEAVPAAVEELHRWDGSSKVMVRVVAEPHDLGGHATEPGQTVFLGIAAANRDPAAFDDPDALRLDRPDAHRHLGFGHGLHFCLGAPLARLEAQVALRGFSDALADVELAVDPRDLRYNATILGRGLAELPVARE